MDSGACSSKLAFLELRCRITVRFSKQVSTNDFRAIWMLLFLYLFLNFEEVSALIAQDSIGHKACLEISESCTNPYLGLIFSKPGNLSSARVNEMRVAFHFQTYKMT